MSNSTEKPQKKQNQEEEKRQRRKTWLERRRNERILFDFGPPPPRKVQCPIVDAHTHPHAPEHTEAFVRVARSYGVRKIVGICNIEEAAALRRAFTGLCEFAVWLRYEKLEDFRRFQQENLALLARAGEEGFTIVKLWFKPEFNAATGLKLDDPRMDVIFERMGELGFSGIVHVADPDSWFTTRYADTSRFGTKEENYVQLENRLSRNPGVKLVGAHMGGDPENLPHLARLLRDHPNLALDSSAAKWVSRELSRKPEASREFLITFQDRVIYGTDLAAWEGAPERHYASRFWTLQKLLESNYRGLLPIYDDEAGGSVRLSGLDLPAEVLEKVYYKNAETWLGVRVQDYASLTDSA